MLVFLLSFLFFRFISNIVISSLPPSFPPQAPEFPDTEKEKLQYVTLVRLESWSGTTETRASSSLARSRSPGPPAPQYCHSSASSSTVYLYFPSKSASLQYFIFSLAISCVIGIKQPEGSFGHNLLLHQMGLVMQRLLQVSIYLPYKPDPDPAKWWKSIWIWINPEKIETWCVTLG